MKKSGVIWELSQLGAGKTPCWPVTSTSNHRHFFLVKSTCPCRFVKSVCALGKNTYLLLVNPAFLIQNSLGKPRICVGHLSISTGAPGWLKPAHLADDAQVISDTAQQAVGDGEPALIIFSRAIPDCKLTGRCGKTSVCISCSKGSHVFFFCTFLH